jgi:hypothetical protein
MAARSLVVVWSAICAFGHSAYVNIDCGTRVLAPSPDTSRCAEAHGHDQTPDIDVSHLVAKKKRGSAMK